MLVFWSVLGAGESQLDLDELEEIQGRSSPAHVYQQDLDL